MDHQQYSTDIDALRGTTRRQQWIIVALVLALLMALWNALNMFGRDRTVVTPPNLEKSFWITQKTASPEYVEQMALWIASLVLDVTPDTIKYKSDLLLQYVAPSAHGQLSEKQTLQTQRLKRDNAATYFVLQTIHIDSERMAAVLAGRLHTLINGRHVDETEKYYFVRFRLEGGRASVTDFREVLHADLPTLLAEASK